MGGHDRAKRLRAARKQRMVGRDEECARFLAAITAETLPYDILFIYGPGGIGKSALAAEFVAICAEHAVACHLIDARHIEPSPVTFLATLPPELRASEDGEPAENLPRHTLIIDGYDHLAPLDGWLRQSYLPELPENTLVALISANPPMPEWRTDPGWRSLIALMPVRNLTPEASRAYLRAANVPEAQMRAVLDFTHGHPLALALVADVFAQRPDVVFQPENEPDIIRTLLESLVQKAPGPAHRAALEVCALVRLTTEPLLKVMLGMSDVRSLFDWLRTLSFIEADRRGIYPHQTAREALVADLRWRNPDWHAELHARARAYYSDRLKHTHDLEQQQETLFDYIYLHRHSPILRSYLQGMPSQGGPSFFTDTLRPADIPALLAMVARHEGEESARIAEYWLARQPQGALVQRDSSGQPVGFLLTLALHEVEPTDSDADPATRAVMGYLRAIGSLRPGERALFYRFWMAGNTYQDFSHAQAHIGVHVVRSYLTTPRLAYSFFPVAAPEFWDMILRYADLQRLSEAEYDVGGRHYSVYGHDWRATSPMAWLNLLAEREMSLTPQLSEPPAPVETLLALSEQEFAAAVYSALKDFRRGDRLRSNPLLRARLVIDRAGRDASQPDRAAALRALVTEAAESLRATGVAREVRYYRVLHHTFFQPAPTQEDAAELLDIPYGSYRRYLNQAKKRIVEMLWVWELHGVG